MTDIPVCVQRKGVAVFLLKPTQIDIPELPYIFSNVSYFSCMLVYPAGITIAIDLFTHTTVFELLLLTFLTAIIFSLLCNYAETTSSPTCRFETMAWFSPFLYVPFYLFAIYAFIFEKEWIRVPGTHTL